MSKNDSYDVSTIRARSGVYMSCDLYDGIHRNQNEVLILLIFLLVPIHAFKKTVRCYKKLFTYVRNYVFTNWKTSRAFLPSS